MGRFFKRSAPPGDAGETATAEAPKPRFEDIRPDPDRIGIAASVPFVRLPKPAKLFADRAARLEALAPGHPLEGYLAFLAKIAHGQARIAPKSAPGQLAAGPGQPAGQLLAAHGLPPLSRDLLRAGDAFSTVLDALLSGVDLSEAPEPAQVAAAALRGATVEDRLDLALQVFEGALPVERMAECVFIAAALQVLLSAHAARLDETALQPVADGVCPCCGGAPSASLIVSWTPADKARYLSCTLCGSLWNHVRIRCTACGSGEGVSYYGLDEIATDVQVETCTSCNSYLKHLHQHRAPALDPIADDVASYGLDLKIAEEGFHRAGLNLLFVM